LWQKLLKDEKMGIAWFVPRANAKPELVAVLPSKSQDEHDSGTPFLPAGLWLLPLPFADDLRGVDVKETLRCSSGLIDQMRVIVQNLQLPKAMYNPMKYPNPALQWHYKILQALALEEEVPDQPEDATLPKYKAINKRVGGYMVEWDQAVGNDAKILADSRAIKREAEDDDDARPKKRAKSTTTSEKTSRTIGDSQLKLAVKQGTLKKMTVAELKDAMTSRGLSVTGKKADLLDRLEQWVHENT
jgi:ATP-dependent DNA helicase 2 subunit 1